MSGRLKAWRSERALSLCSLALLAVVGGGIGFWVFLAERQKQIVTSIQRVTGGSSVQYGYELDEKLQWDSADPPRPEWLRNCLGIDYLATARGVCLHHATDADARLLQNLPGLWVVNISASDHLTDRGLAELENLPELEKLVLGGLTTSDAALAFLPKLPRLKTLQMFRCPSTTDEALEWVSRIAGLRKFTLMESQNSNFTSAGVAKLSRLRNLEELFLDFHGHVNDAVLKPLGHLPNLRRLTLYFGSGEAGDGLKHLASLPKLEMLTLHGPEALSDDALLALPALTELQSLSLLQCSRITGAGLSALGKLPNLRELDLGDMPGLDDAAIESLESLPNLTGLSIYGHHLALGDAALRRIGTLSKLRMLNLAGCDAVTDAGLPHLAALKDLEKLDLGVSDSKQFSRKALSELRGSLPGCEIHCEEIRLVQ